jgi:hypothetical protein
LGRYEFLQADGKHNSAVSGMQVMLRSQAYHLGFVSTASHCNIRVAHGVQIEEPFAQGFVLLGTNKNDDMFARHHVKCALQH